MKTRFEGIVSRRSYGPFAFFCHGKICPVKDKEKNEIVLWKGMAEYMNNRIGVHRDKQHIYDILLSTSFDQLAEEIKKLGVENRKICIVTDSTVAGLYLDLVAGILAGCCKQVISFTFPAGEEHKNLNTVQELYKTLIVHRFDRNDVLAALGGGVVGDLCGYAAATYLRGISFFQIPTTLLSQVDSSIGGKTGVDFDSFKNMVGAFHMPKLVYTNVSTLLTLPKEQFTSGMGEIIKHGLIKDAVYYQWLNQHVSQIMNRNLEVCMEMIRGSNEIKRKVVEEDPTEQGERALLNFGHTLGHAIEKWKNFQMLHGHCVAVGALAAAWMSQEKGWISKEQVTELKGLMETFHMPVSVSGVDLEQVVDATKNDKKMDGGRIRFILLKEIGHAVIDKQVTEEAMKKGLSMILE